MTTSEFLNLPKIKLDFKDRIRKQIEILRSKIELTPSNDEIIEKDRCCEKRAFNSEQDALEAISLSPKQGRKNNYKPIRAYECDNGKWHLTHLSLSDYKSKKDNYRFKI